MKRLLLAFAFLSLAGLPNAAADNPKPARPVLDTKIYPLTEAEPQMTVEVLNTLLGDADLVMEKAKPIEAIGGLGGGGLPDKTVPLWRCAVDDRTRTFILRGSAGHIAIANDVVALLNRKPDQPMPATKTVQAFTLKHTNAGEVANAINALEFENLKMATGGEAMLLIVAGEETQKQVEAIVKALDVQAKK